MRCSSAQRCLSHCRPARLLLRLLRLYAAAVERSDAAAHRPLPASLQLLPRIPSGHQRHLPAIEARLKQAVRADGEWTVSEHKVEAEMDDVRVELSVALLLQDVWLPSAENGEAVDSVSVHFLSLLDERKESGLQEEKPLPSQSGPKAKRVKQRA